MEQHRYRLIAVVLLTTAILALVALAADAGGAGDVLADSAGSGAPVGVSEGEKAVISIVPADTFVSAGDIFTVTVRIQSEQEAVDVAEAHIDFNPKVLQVVTLVFGTALPDPAWWLGEYVNNTNGYVSYGASQSWGEDGVTGAFDLVSIQFEALRSSIGTALSFSDAEDRRTTVVSLGYALPLRMVDGLVMISDPNSTPTPTSTLMPTGTSTATATVTLTPTPTVTPSDPVPLKLFLPLLLRFGLAS